MTDHGLLDHRSQILQVISLRKNRVTQSASAISAIDFVLTHLENYFAHSQQYEAEMTSSQAQCKRYPCRTLITGQPRSLQTDDGKIYIFSHQGSDDPYGKTDQAIIMDTFRLVKN